MAMGIFNQDNELELTEYAQSKFADSSDDLPRFFSIEDGSKIVDFNLISFSFLQRKESLDNISFYISLKERDEHISKSIDHAEKSFQECFNDIVKNKHQDKIGLYKITKVTSKKHFGYPVSLDFFLKIDDEFIDIVNSKETEELIKSDDVIYQAIIEKFSSNTFRVC